MCSDMLSKLLKNYICFLSVGFLLIHQYLTQPIAQDLFSKALHCGWVTTIFRDEVLHTHSFVQQFFDTFKGYNKKVTEVKEAYNWVLQHA